MNKNIIIIAWLLATRFSAAALIVVSRLQQTRLRSLSMICIILCGCMHQKAPPCPPIPRPISCEQQCLNRALACAQVCQSCPECMTEAKIKASHAYLRYIWLQRAEGRVVARELNSYHDPLACTKVTCDCQADYQACKRGCRGQVQIKLKDEICIDSRIPCDYWLRDILAG